MTHHDGVPGEHDDDVDVAAVAVGGGTTSTEKGAAGANGSPRADGLTGDNDEFVYPVDHGAGTEEDTDAAEGGYVESTDHGSGT